MSPDHHASLTTDLVRVRALLSRDPITAAYMLGDLDPVYQQYCRWWLASDRSDDAHDTAALLLYTGLSAPVILAFGDPAGIALAIDRALPELPERALGHLLPEHLAVFDRHFHLQRLRPMVRMGLRAPDFLPTPRTLPAGYLPVAPLGHRDTGDLMALFVHYPDHFFEPHQLTSGYYCGIRSATDSALVALAGVHVVSPTDRVAAIGNIVTHPDHRGLGLSTLCTASLVDRLIADGMDLVALNVERANALAARIYEKLGFREHTTYLEGFFVRTLDDRITRN